MKHRIAAAAAAVLMLASAAGCSINNNEGNSSSAADASQTQSAADNNTSASDASADSKQEKSESTKSDNKASAKLNGSSVELSEGAVGISAEGSVLTISAAGEYTLTGTLDDGQIVVNVPKTEKVDIFLANVTVSSSATAPIRIEQADGVTLHLVEGSVNTFTDSAANDLSACISAKDDLTIKGKGTLKVTGSAKHAIKSSNDIKIKNGVFELSAVKTAIYGEDSVQLTGGSIVITSCGDGIKASNTEEAEKGFVSSEEAEVEIQNAAGNGIEAVTGVTVKSGKIRIHSLKQAVNCKVQELAEGCVEKF